MGCREPERTPERKVSSGARSSIRTSSTRRQCSLSESHATIPFPTAQAPFLGMPGSRLRELNGFELDRTVEDAVDQTLKVASGEIDEESMASWLRSRVRPALTD
jgi:hypothetical protein